MDGSLLKRQRKQEGRRKRDVHALPRSRREGGNETCMFCRGAQVKSFGTREPINCVIHICASLAASVGSDMPTTKLPVYHTQCIILIAQTSNSGG